MDPADRWRCTIATPFLGEHVADLVRAPEQPDGRRHRPQADRKCTRGDTRLPGMYRELPAHRAALLALGPSEGEPGHELDRERAGAAAHGKPHLPAGDAEAHSDGDSWVRVTSTVITTTTYQ